MKLIKAVIRPEMLYEVITALEEKGFRGFTVMDLSLIHISEPTRPY